MKRLLTMSVSLALLFSGCSQAVRLDSEQPRGEHVGDATLRSVRFFISTPAGDGVQFDALRTGIQTKSEMLINTLDFYEFTGDSGSEVLKEVYRNVPFNALEGGVSLTLKVRDEGVKRYAIVANHHLTSSGASDELGNIAIGTSLADFLKVATNSIAGKSLTTPLVMTALTEPFEVKAGMPAQRAELKRIMARLDIKNYEKEFTIERVILDNSSSNNYLFHQTVGSQVPASAELMRIESEQMPVTETAAGEDPAIVMTKVAKSSTDATHILYKHVLYPYISEATTDKSKAPRIIIEGTLFKGTQNEVKHSYTLELKIDGSGEYLGFERNHRYTIIIKKTVAGEADIKVVVDKWSSVELPMHQLEVTAPFSSGFIYPWKWRIGDCKFDKSKQKFVVSKDLHKGNEDPSIDYRYVAEFYVDRNTEWEFANLNDEQIASATHVTPWLQLNINSYDFFAHEDQGRSFPAAMHLTFTQGNETGVDRSYSFYLRSTVDHNKKTLFTVVQSKDAEVK